MNTSVPQLRMRKYQVAYMFYSTLASTARSLWYYVGNITDLSLNKYNQFGELFYRCEVDIDECTEGTHTCTGDNQGCINTDGAFTCSCLLGYELADGACVLSK